MKEGEMLKIQNEPDYAKDFEFIVAREIDGEYWFYGAYANGWQADQVAYQIGGVVFHTLGIRGRRSNNE